MAFRRSGLSSGGALFEWTDERVKSKIDLTFEYQGAMEGLAWISDSTKTRITTT